MMCDRLQGRLLKFLTSTSGARSVLELGTFTGYSTLCFAEGLRNPKSFVLTCEIDDKAADIAQEYFDQSGLGEKIRLKRQRASEVIDAARSAGNMFDIVFIDADKKYYKDYVSDLMGLKKEKSCLLNDNAIIIVDNTLWKGLVLAKDEHLQEFAPDAADFGNPKRMTVIAGIMNEFNEFCNAHPDLHQLILPIRDGLSVIQYRNKVKFNYK